jgi:malonyl-CoA/methylmalonyl-CoA synthetase
MDQLLTDRAEQHLRRNALIDPGGAMTYQDLLDSSRHAAAGLLRGSADLEESPVPYLVAPGCRHVVVQWAIWRAGGIAVPLAPSHPPREVAYVLDDARPRMAVADDELAERLRPLAAERGIALLRAAELASAPAAPIPGLAPERRALMVYTSGTTGRPKGVVTTHGGLRAQVDALVEAWRWVPDDRILHLLPLHHVHGIVNALGCALGSGAACELRPRFDPLDAWERLASGDITLFMAVPTMYGRLIAAWEDAGPATRRRWSDGAARLRLMVSGSAALPVAVLADWRRITGHTLLERYGMTEIGMALSNPLHGERRPGTVGRPLPGVEVRLVDEGGGVAAEGTPGEIEVRGPQVFREYWHRPEETARAFHDGWFRTGDVAVLERGYYRILGRQSTDIIKSGGYKISALEVEEVLREHPEIQDCAVVGLFDQDLGERVAAAVVCRRAGSLDPAALRAWARERLAPYKVPRDVRFLPELPRNAMGKVTKPELKATLNPQ